MPSEQQQRIMGYFMEETQEHLNTMEPALLSLLSTIEDKEVLNEVYRAAHSIKGGAAMLELNSIQKIAHRLEDCFKDLKEFPVKPDQQLEFLFLRVFGNLQKLVEQLTPSGLKEEIADEIMSDTEPALAELKNHLKKLQQKASSSPAVTAQELVLAGHYDDRMEQARHTPAASKTDGTTELRETKPTSRRHTEVGLAELDTLADIFEGQTPELDDTWEKEEIISLDRSEFTSDSVDSLSWDDPSDFSDLIDSWETTAADSQAVGSPETSASTDEDFIDWLGEDFLEEVALNFQDATDDFSDLLFEADSPESLTAATGRTSNFSNLFGDTSEILGDGEEENIFLPIDNSSQEVDNLSNGEKEGDEAEPRDLESDFSDLLTISANHQENWGFEEELMIDGEANDLDLAELEFDESLTDLNLTNTKDLDFNQLESEQEIFALGEETTTKALESKEDDLVSLLGVETTSETEGLDWEGDLFATEAEVSEVELEAPTSTTGEEDDLASLLGVETTSETEELDWETDLFVGEGEVSEVVEVPSQTTTETEDLGSLLGEEMSIDTEILTFAEEEVSESEMNSDWTLESVNEEGIDDFLEEEPTEALEPKNIQKSLQGETFEVINAQEVEEVDKTNEELSNEQDLDELLEQESEQTASIDELTLDTLEEAQSESFGEFNETNAAPVSVVSSEFNELEAMLEEEVPLTNFASTVAEFDELEAMLEEELPLTNVPSTVAEFDELEAMLLEEEPSPAMAANTPLVATAASSDSVDIDVFDDLENLLDEETPEVEQLPELVEGAVNADEDDEFGDLEKLLEQADKTMGGPPTIKADQRQTKSQSRPRPRMFEQTMRVQIKRLDDLNNLVGELVVNRNSLEQDQERLRQFLDNLNHQVLSLNDVGARMQDLYERSLLESSLLASRHDYRSFFGGESSSENSHSHGQEYDPLEMDRFTGFHTLSQEMIELIVRVRESASDIVFLVDGTDQVARTLRQITTQLQEGLTRARMVPFAQTADRLPRAVRDISLKLGKQAQLQVEGRETLIDKMIIEHLNAPMTHLVNNAITHGIEPPEVRQAAGKSSVGKITVRAFYQGNQAVISISDDGAGIDPERVRNKVIEKKFLSPTEAKKLTNLDLYEFLFDAGFTTKDKEDEYAGRGVGMDVVRTSLREIRGTIHTDSTLGKGTTFTIRLPLTLSIGKALCCLSERATIAFPMDGVEDTFDISPDRIQTDSEGQTFIQWKDTQLPFKPLSELLKYNRYLSRGSVYGGKREDGLISILVLRSAGNFLSIQVDRVLSEQEIVIKQLEGPPPKPVGIAGATVLGDGRIMPIADVMELIDLSRRPNRPDSAIWSITEGDAGASLKQVETPHEPMVLIIDDSITVRSLLEMTFSKAGYRVEQARDGQEAWEKLRSGLPCDIIFCDIEMPRMNGMELLKKLQEDENLRDIPISMLTSRGADRHRQMATQLGASGYFTKPYLEEVLLEAAQQMINGEVLLNGSSNA